MDIVSYGFFGGAAPGFTYFLITMFRLRKVKIKAVELARQQGEFLDFDSSENQSFDFLLNPQKFIKPTDGRGAQSGKNLLLSVRDRTWKRLWIAIILMAIGIPVGMLLAVASNEYFLRHPW